MVVLPPPPPSGTALGEFDFQQPRFRSSLLTNVVIAATNCGALETNRYMADWFTVTMRWHSSKAQGVPVEGNGGGRRKENAIAACLKFILAKMRAQNLMLASWYKLCALGAGVGSLQRSLTQCRPLRKYADVMRVRPPSQQDPGSGLQWHALL